MLIITTAQKDPKIIDAILRQVLPYVDTPHRVEPFTGTLPNLAEGEVLLGMGAPVLDALKASGAVPDIKRNTSLNSAREKAYPYRSGHVMMTYDPFVATVDPAMEPNIVWDVRLACRFHDTGTLEPPLGDYLWVPDFGSVVDYVNKEHKRTGKPVAVAPDLETIGLDWLHPGNDERPPARIVTISFTCREGMAQVYRVPESGQLPSHVWEQVNWLLTSEKVNSVGANLKFDANWMEHHWKIRVANQRADTMLIGSLINENRSNSLNLHAKVYTTLGGYDTALNSSFDKSRMDLALEADPDTFLTYAGGDTDACLRTYNRMRPQLINDKRLTAFYTQLLQPSAKVFQKMEQRGMVVDLDRYKELKHEVKADIDRLTEDALEMLPRRLRYKYADNLSLGRPVVLRDFMFSPLGLNLKPQMMTEKSKEPSTAMEHLEMFHDHPEAKVFVDVMRELNSAKKTMSTYIVGFLKHLRADGRFHPTYMLHRGDYDGGDSGAVTGRTSAKDPAVQTIPKHTRWAKALRSVYVCPPGMAILKLDYSQGELRVTACVANEKSMIQTYRKGIDLHLRTGALVNDITLEQALALKASKDPKDKDFIARVRQGGKAGNFGLIYGMSAAGFQNYARVAYGVTLTMTEAEKFRNAFFAEYPGLLDWHEQYRQIAHLHGHVRSPLGRIRHLPLINSRDRGLRAESERQAINSPIQSCLSDMMQWAMVELDRRYPDLWIFSMTHDDLGMYVPEDEVTEWAIRCRDVLQNLPLHKLGWNPPLTFVADAEASHTNLSECRELDLDLAKAA